MRHWVFDLDGTLVDSFGHYFASLEAIFARRGVEFTEELRDEALTRPIRDILRERLGDAAADAAMRELQVQSNEDARSLRPFDGVHALLADLAGRGARIAVWTNRDLESARIILESTGLDRFAEVCVSGTCVAPKPNPQGLKRILDRFECRASEVTVVGDHEHDVVASKALGARAVRASWHSYWDVSRCERSDRQFYSVREFASWAFLS